MIHDHAPQTSGELEQVVSEVVPAGGRVSAEGIDYDGCSSLERWGSILINAHAVRSPVRFAEAIIHEGAHNVLFGTSPVEFHLKNAIDERHRSPLRVDPRPLDGIYHATFVLARMCFAMREFAASPRLDAAQRAEAARYAEQSRQRFWDGHAVLDQHADYTEEGRAIMSSARDYMRSLEDMAAIPVD